MRALVSIILLIVLVKEAAACNNKLAAGKGDCNSDSGCKDVSDGWILRCGNSNCANGDDDCCFKPRACDSNDQSRNRCCSKVWDHSNLDDCCTNDRPCKIGEGDCDDDDECEGDLVCGNKNCPWDGKAPGFLSSNIRETDDCCVRGDDRLHFGSH